MTTNKTIHDFTEISTLVAADELVVYDVSDNTTNKVTIAAVAALISGGGTTSLDALSDVSVSNATNNQVLTYRTSDQTWIATSVSSGAAIIDASSISAAGGILETQFSGLGYVKKTGTQAFTEVCTIPSSDITGLGQLATVPASVTSAAASTYLMYNGSSWVPTSITAGAGGSLATLSDVSLNSPSNQQVLTYDSSSAKWINASPAAVVVDASNVQAAGAVMTSFFSGASGYMRKLNSGNYDVTTAIPAANITDLGTLATTSTKASAQSFLGFSTFGTAMTSATTTAAGQALLGMTAFGISLVSAADATAAGVLLNLGTLATTSTKASAQSFLGFGTFGTAMTSATTTAAGQALLGMSSFGISLVSAANAAAAGTLLNLGTLATVSTAASGQSFLNLGTLATTSTAASAKTFLGITAFGSQITSVADASAAKALLGFEVSSTIDNIVVFSNVSGGTKNSVVTLESAGSIYGYQGKINSISGSSYTVVSSDTGKILITTAAVTCSMTLPAGMKQGFNFTWVQHGAGVIQFVAGTSATLEQRQSYTRSAGQHAVGGIVVSENSNGTAAHYTLAGDMTT